MMSFLFIGGENMSVFQFGMVVTGTTLILGLFIKSPIVVTCGYITFNIWLAAEYLKMYIVKELRK